MPFARAFKMIISHDCRSRLAMWKMGLAAKTKQKCVSRIWTLDVESRLCCRQCAAHLLCQFGIFSISFHFFESQCPLMRRLLSCVLRFREKSTKVNCIRRDRRSFGQNTRKKWIIEHLCLRHKINLHNKSNDGRSFLSLLSAAFQSATVHWFCSFRWWKVNFNFFLGMENSLSNFTFSSLIDLKLSSVLHRPKWLNMYIERNKLQMKLEKKTQLLLSVSSLQNRLSRLNGELCWQ